MPIAADNPWTRNICSPFTTGGGSRIRLFVSLIRIKANDRQVRLYRLRFPETSPVTILSNSWRLPPYDLASMSYLVLEFIEP